MAEAAVGFAASIAGLASFGIQIVTTLNTFSTTFAKAEQHVKDISASVALTSSILDSIGKMITEYEAQFGLTVENFIAAKDLCERNFQTLWVALRQVKKSEVEKKIQTKEIAEKLGVWVRMMHAMGGADALKGLIQSIEASKSNLQLLLSSLQFLVLRGLRKSNLLSEEQSEDFRLFMTQLPELVAGLQQAGLIKAGVYRNKRPEKPAETNSVNVEPHIVVAGSSEDRSLPLLRGAPVDKADDVDVGFGSLRQQEDVDDPPRLPGGTRDIQQGSTSTWPVEPKVPEMTRSIEGGDDVVVVEKEHLSRRISVGEPVNSSGSEDPVPRASPDTQSIYEAWVLETTPREYTENAHIVLCGMRMRVYSVTSPTTYTITRRANDKGKPKRMVGDAETRIRQEPHEASNDRMLLGLPKSAREKVTLFLQNKNRRDRRERESWGWKIVSIERQTRKFAFIFGRDKPISPPKWLIVLRGVVNETTPLYRTSSTSYYSYSYSSASEPEGPEEVIVRGRYRSPLRAPVPIPEGQAEGDDIVEVIEEHSPPRRRAQRRRSSWYKSPYESAPVRRRADRTLIPERASDETGAHPEEDAERLMDEYLATFLKQNGEGNED
ncbi:hypothetical protein NA57DRAFT_69939 [Rhizodiscina lignyota]|uniref:Fungal N-terminal domain-containing protein n=1 Tax=Rhizodiscina lignyota TaxID=1504668 RepID=A0A9P4IQ86_9PEZI|nr:hypothetical protein NA57DRAFT_69939 [Rhizodiscina lignyota]